MGYVPKSLSTPFKIQTVSLSALSSESAASSEADAQTSVCPVRALRIYIDRSASFRQSNQLFVCYGGCARGRAVSKQRLSHWIVDAITAAYTNQGLECPLHIRGHSTRAMASSWAWSRGMSIQDICVAAGWSSENTFARFYRLDVQSFASQVLSVSGWCMFTTLFALHTLTNTVVLPCAQCRFLYCVVLSSDTFIMLGWGHAIQSCAVPYARCASCPVSAQPTLFLSRYANLYTFGLDAHWLTATYQRWARLQRHYCGKCLRAYSICCVLG